ncbi:MAG: PrsW family glutamic-type intramembrane protease [Candidatus Saliniplasma sp.]
MFSYIEAVKNHVRGKINQLDIKISYSKSEVDGFTQKSRSIADRYAINKAHSDIEEGRISESVLTILSITPIWPVVFYYILYRISKDISIHTELQNDISSLNIGQKSNGKAINQKDHTLFKATLGHKIFFTAFSTISIIGFLLTFNLIGVGFFAPFWIILLHNRLSYYLDRESDRVYAFHRKNEKGYITGATVAAFLCFGATAGFIASISNTIYASMISPIALLSPTAFIIFLVTFIAPLTEEPSKVAGFFLIDKRSASRIPLFYWAFFGMIAGLGFALIEDYSYFQQFFVTYSTKDSLNLLLMRLTVPVHLIGSALAALGVGLWRKTDRLYYLVVYILLAMLVHGSYNFMVSIGSV